MLRRGCYAARSCGAGAGAHDADGLEGELHVNSDLIELDAIQDECHTPPRAREDACSGALRGLALVSRRHLASLAGGIPAGVPAPKVSCMSPQHPLRRALTGLLVLATFATAAAGMLLRTQVAGLVLLAAAALWAVCAWYALGSPVRRRDIARAGN